MLGGFHRSRTAIDQVLGACVLFLRESKRCARFGYLTLGLLNPRLLRGYLRAEIGDCRVGLFDLSLRLIKSRAIVAIVDAKQRPSSNDELVVRDRQIDDRPRDVCAYRNDAGIDECVIGQLELARVEPPKGAADAEDD